MPRSKHGALVAATVTTVTLDADYDSVEILNRGASDLWVRLDKTDPVIGADDNYVCVPGGFVVLPVPTAGNTEVRLISAGTPAYSVAGV